MPACRLVVIATAAALAAVTTRPAGAADGSSGAVIVRLTASAAHTESGRLAGAGAERIDAQLRLWRLPGDVAAAVLPALRAHGAIAAEQREKTYVVEGSGVVPDPLEVDEWWRAQIGIDGVAPPGPGIPVTIVDSGLDLAHPEFSGRPDTVALNAQEPAGVGGEHGTSVASVIAAPANGVGIVGIYPQAVLRSWDAALGAGTRLDSGQIAAGILAAARAGPGVINLSVGGSRDLAVELAVSQAVALGSLVVAASGNSGLEGNPISYPAALPHVTTVAAADNAGAVASFSSRSPYVDLAAPGVGIVVASALGGNWQPEDGTSFASPIVAGAAAWIWTARPELRASQVAEILRLSARDLPPAGRDPASGFGELDVAAALALPAPIRDPFEPNDDIDEVDPAHDLYLSKEPPLTTRTRRQGRIAGRVDAWEDPRDVFRVWLPPKRQVVAVLRATDDSDLSLFSQTATTVAGRFATAGRLARASAGGKTERLVFANKGAGRWAYLAVSLPTTTTSTTYRLAVTSKPIAKKR
jgi:subtilisin family serine protease